MSSSITFADLWKSLISTYEQNQRDIVTAYGENVYSKFERAYQHYRSSVYHIVLTNQGPFTEEYLNATLRKRIFIAALTLHRQTVVSNNMAEAVDSVNWLFESSFYRIPSTLQQKQQQLSSTSQSKEQSDKTQCSIDEYNGTDQISLSLFRTLMIDYANRDKSIAEYNNDDDDDDDVDDNDDNDDDDDDDDDNDDNDNEDGNSTNNDAGDDYNNNDDGIIPNSEEDDLFLPLDDTVAAEIAGIPERPLRLTQKGGRKFGASGLRRQHWAIQSYRNFFHQFLHSVRGCRLMEKMNYYLEDRRY